MKYRYFVKLLKINGWTLDRASGSHNIFVKDGKHISIPCRNEINDMMARRLIKENELKEKNK